MKEDMIFVTQNKNATLFTLTDFTFYVCSKQNISRNETKPNFIVHFKSSYKDICNTGRERLIRTPLIRSST